MKNKPTPQIPTPVKAKPAKPVKAKPIRVKKPKMFRRVIRYRDALEAASRLRISSDGKRYVVRFTRGQRVEHLVLLFSFTTLAVTGLAQTFYTSPIGNFILTSLGGIDSARVIHHMAAFVFIIQSLYHVALFINELFVYHRITRMIPDLKDFTDLIAMLKFNLGLSKQHPHFDRYNFEEKAEYWALVWGTLIMGATGLMQWFPLQVTQVLPGWVIPVGRALHKWEAILAVLAILTWHFYHTMIKTRNFSIFTGKMTIKQMEEEHPVELAYLEKAAAAVTSRTWPVVIQFPLEEPKPEPKVQVKPSAKETTTNPPAETAVDEAQGKAEKPALEPEDASSPLSSGEGG